MCLSLSATGQCLSCFIRLDIVYVPCCLVYAFILPDWRNSFSYHRAFFLGNGHVCIFYHLVTVFNFRFTFFFSFNSSSVLSKHSYRRKYVIMKYPCDTAHYFAHIRGLLGYLQACFKGALLSKIAQLQQRKPELRSISLFSSIPYDKNII